MPVQLVTVTKNQELVPTGYFFLRLFDHCALEFDDLPAFHTHEMIMVVVFNFVTNHPVIKVMTLRKAGFHQELHRAINGRVANCRELLVHRLKDLVTGDVTFGTKKRVENRTPLLRMLKTALRQKIG